MRTFRGMILFLAAFLAFGFLPGSAHAGTMPASLSLIDQPYSVSWPDSPGFTARLKVESGPEGADFKFQIKPTGWSETTYGIVFRDGQAELDGPGELATNRVGPGGPWGQPGSCMRGSGPIPVYGNELNLPPNTTTVVEVPVSLNASPLVGMNSTLKFEYFTETSAIAPTVEAQVDVGGTKGVNVDFGIDDAATKSAEVWNGKPIRLAGTTSPPLPNTEIRIKAEPFAAPANGSPPVRWVVVTTDSAGKFLSKELSFRRSAFWRLTAYPGAGPTRDGEPSCGPVLLTRQDSWRADYPDLTDQTFNSESVKGPKFIGQKSVRLSFEARLVDHDLNPKTPSRWYYNLIGSAGCNTLGGRYRLKDGVLTWSKNLSGTEMGCPKPVDDWLRRTLRRGVKARMVKGKLVLTGKRGTRIVLTRSTGEHGFEKPKPRVPKFRELLDRRYKSIKAVGNPLLEDKTVYISFFKGSSSPRQPERTGIGVYAGCNNWGSNAFIRKGRLTAYGRGDSTGLGCEDETDSWLRDELRRSLRIEMVGKRLILTRPSEGLKIVMVRTAPEVW